MAAPINLNKARKARAKADAVAKAAENRVRFGQDKSVRKAKALEADRASRQLDGAKRDD